MTETTTFPFSAVGEGVDDDARGRDRRSLAVVLGGGLVAVALIGGAVFAFTGGGGDLPLDTGVALPADTGSAAAPVAVELEGTLPAANTESIARNPFEPKYVEPAPVEQAPVQEPTDPAAVPPGAVVPDEQGGYVPAPNPVGPTSPQSPQSPTAPVAPREYRLVLTGVTTDGEVPTAQFTIDGAVSAVTATEVFGPQRQLLLRSLQQGPKDGQWTATIQVGDARPIDVVTGEPVFVQ